MVACSLVIVPLVSATFLYQIVTSMGLFLKCTCNFSIWGVAGHSGPQRLPQGFLRRHSGSYRALHPSLAPPSKEGSASPAIFPCPEPIWGFLWSLSIPAHLGTIDLSSLNPYQTPSALQAGLCIVLCLFVFWSGLSQVLFACLFVCYYFSNSVS